MHGFSYTHLVIMVFGVRGLCAPEGITDVIEPVNCDHLFKVIVVGDSGVGKTCLINRMCTDSFTDGISATIGVDMKVKNVRIGDKMVKLSIWDTAGQERYQSLTRQYYRKAHAVLFVYDCTDRRSFENLGDRWLPEFDGHRADTQSNTCLSVIVANKVDEVNTRLVTTDEGCDFARFNNSLYYETSARTAEGVEDGLVWGIISTLMDQAAQNQNKALPQSSGMQVLSEDDITAHVFSSETRRKKSGCCGR